MTASPTTDTASSHDTQAEQLLHVDPGTLIIGANVRVDTRPDAKEFAANIKARGVLQAITAYRDEAGALVVTQGQRRTLVAARVGTPTGTVPVHVKQAPTDADRITDQISENVHRVGMHEQELRDGIEQLALVGVSAAQIAKRTALPRGTVTAALAVAMKPAAKERMDAGMSLDDAALYAEFDGNDDAIAALDGHGWQPLAHVAQRLRDQKAMDAAVAAEVARLRADGLPVLDPGTLTGSTYDLALANLVDAAGEAVPQEAWATLVGAAIHVEGYYDDQDDDSDRDDVDAPNADAASGASGVRFERTWVCLDPNAAGLVVSWRYRRDVHTVAAPVLNGDLDPEQVQRRAEQARQAAEETQRQQRREVRENNAQWRSAEAVRREWLARFIHRKTAPSGAEALIAAAVVAHPAALSRALSDGHSMLLSLRSSARDDQGSGYVSGATRRHNLMDAARTAKAATMLTLAAVLAAWEDNQTPMTWRAPNGWDGQIMAALIGWGYPASDVERLLLPEDSDSHPEPRNAAVDTTESTDHDTDPIDRACQECGSRPGERCQPWCIGKPDTDSDTDTDTAEAPEQ